MLRTVRLRFGAASREAETHVNLSAMRLDGSCLWLAGDETATIERLVSSSGDEYGDQATFRLADFVDLPGEADGEADVEGLARAGDFLWAVGSHSLKRKKIKDKHAGGKALERLATVTGDVNRQVLVRLPVAEDEDGRPAPVRETGVGGQRLTAAVLGAPGEPSLRDLLADDLHLGPFLPIPSKDNGLDIEGLAVAGERVYLGLRGPVLRGWAVLLELSPYTDSDEPGRLRLRELAEGRPYRKHVLDLDGLGVRDLCPHGDDLLVLAGPTTDVSGPVRVYRWRGGCLVDAPTVVRGEQLTRELDLPHGDGVDHAEGIDVLPPRPDGAAQLLVVYDSPAPERLGDDGSVLADVVALPG